MGLPRTHGFLLLAPAAVLALLFGSVQGAANTTEGAPASGEDPKVVVRMMKLLRRIRAIRYPRPGCRSGRWADPVAALRRGSARRAGGGLSARRPGGAAHLPLMWFLWLLARAQALASEQRQAQRAGHNEE